MCELILSYSFDITNPVECSAAWLCFGAYRSAGPSNWSWRVPSLLQCTIPIAQLVSIWFIPESPRWLVAHGRVCNLPLPLQPYFVGEYVRCQCTETTYITLQEGEATRVLCKYHANGGGEHDPLVVFEMAQIRHAVRTERESGSKTNWLSLVSTPGNRKRMMIVIALAVFSQWRYVCGSWILPPPPPVRPGARARASGDRLTLLRVVETVWCRITSI